MDLLGEEMDRQEGGKKKKKGKVKDKFPRIWGVHSLLENFVNDSIYTTNFDNAPEP